MGQITAQTFCFLWPESDFRLCLQIMGHINSIHCQTDGNPEGGVFQKQNPPTCPETWPPTWSPPQSCWLIEADGGVLHDHTDLLVSFTSIITNSMMTSSTLSDALHLTACIRIIPEFLKVRKLLFFVIWKSGVLDYKKIICDRDMHFQRSAKK